MTDNAVQLACEQCKKRKSRCNKRFPCSACTSAGLECRPVQRARLPRGRTGKIKKRNAALEDKVARLESLLQKIEAQVHENEQPLDPRIDFNANREGPSATQRVQYANKIEHFVARDFWSALASEVSGLRETLEESDEDDTQVEAPSQSVITDAQPLPSQYSFIFQRNAAAGNETSTSILTSSLTMSTRHILLDLYKKQVDVLFKVLHWPTFLDMVMNQHSSTSTAAKALENAVYFLALTSTTPKDCERFRLGNRTQLLEQACNATEASLAEADLITTSEIVVLQAFVLYLAAVRGCMGAGSTWTLIALAVRIADACGVGPENVQQLPPFEFEIRRRVWFSIGMLDSQTAFGRGSLPLLSHRDLASPPLNINDSEMSSQNVHTVSESSFTDMTFSSLCHHSMICQRKLCDPSIPKWEDRVDVVAGFELFVNQNFRRFEFSDETLQKYTALGAKDMTVSMNLLLRRPPYKNVGDPVPDSDDFDVLGMACRVLQSGLFKRNKEDFAQYHWFSWPKWYALAVVLVELLNHKGGPEHDRAFAVAQESYADYAQSASDAHSSLLWKPVTKLMRRVERLSGKTRSSKVNPMLISEPEPVLDSSLGNIFDRPTSVTASLGVSERPATQVSMSESGPGVLNASGDTPWLRWDDFLDGVTHNIDII